MKNLFKYLYSVIGVLITVTLLYNLFYDYDVQESGASSGYSPKTFQKGGHNIYVKIDGLTSKQHKLLKYAYHIAKADGIIYPEILQGILWQESRVGSVKNYKVAGQEFGLSEMRRYYGIGQIKIAAARDVLKRWPELGKFDTNEELVANLILNDKFNIRIASKYLIIVGMRKNKTYRGRNFTITAYNQGIGGASKKNINTWHYTVSVNKHTKMIIKKFNDKRINTARVDIKTRKF